MAIHYSPFTAAAFPRGRLCDFARIPIFWLAAKERDVLMLQNATSKPGRDGRRKRPCAYIEHGASATLGCASSNIPALDYSA